MSRASLSWTPSTDQIETPTLHRGHGGEFWGSWEYRPDDPARLIA
jgi:uncharacterized protein (DUF58 family)